MKEPFGKPGLPPNWSPASKQGIGTACNDTSKVWFTIANGIITEVFYPKIDTANTRDIQFLITDGKTFFDEERRDTVSKIEYIDPQARAKNKTYTAMSGRYRIIKRVIADPSGQSVVINTLFQALKGTLSDYQIFILLAPHVKNKGYGNYGKCVRYGDRDYLIAWREDIVLALTSEASFTRMSCGYSGYSDGWQDLKDDFIMGWKFERVDHGNIALMAEIKPSKDFAIVLSFGKDEAGAVFEASSAIEKGYSNIEREYIKGWHDYLSGLEDLSAQSFDGGRLYRISAMALKAHEDKTDKGGVIASLSIPWGEARDDTDAGGYHLVWPRDLVKAGFSFMAMGDMETSVHILKFLQRTQKTDGSWAQNMWLDGRPYWNGVQLDEVTFPVILAWRLKKMAALKQDFYPMVKKALSLNRRDGRRTQAFPRPH
jgi:glucoamylase